MNLFAILDILTFKLYRLLRDKGFVLITTYKSSPNLSFFFLTRYLTLGRVSHLQTLYITNVSSKEELRHILIYHYIAAYYIIANDLNLSITETSISLRGKIQRFVSGIKTDSVL